ncbi:MAG: antibiotic biosynthesis monooxygenase family protein [Nitrososphaerales archaeon]
MSDTESSPNFVRYARSITLAVKGENIEDFLSAVRRTIAPSVKKQKGARRHYLMRSPTNEREFVSITLWNTKEDADEYQKSGSYSTNVEAVRNFLDTEPVLSEYEVVFHDINAEDLPPPESAKEKIEEEKGSSMTGQSRKRLSPKRKTSSGRQKRNSKQNARRRT